MKIKMLSTAPGADDGIHVLEYEEGETYDVSEDLARVFVAEEVAEAIDELPEQPAVEPEHESAVPVGAGSDDDVVDVAALKRDDLVALAAERGVEVAPKATVAQLREALAAAEAAAESEASEEGS